MSDMLRPLPELDFNFVPFDSAHEAVSAIHPVVSPVNDCQSDGLSGLNAAVLHAEEGDAASHVICSDDSFSSGSENSPGGFRKRHNVSPFRVRVDKKLLQIPKDCGRGAQHGSCSDTAITQPAVSDRGCGTRYGQSDTVVGRLVSSGRGRAVRRGLFSDAAVSRPAFGRGRGWSSRAAPPGQSVLQPELQSHAVSAALHNALSADTGRRHERQRMRSVVFHNSGNKPDGRVEMMSSAASEGAFLPADDAMSADTGRRHERQRMRSDMFHKPDAGVEMMSSAASEGAFLPAEQQLMPVYSAPFEESVGSQATTNTQMPVDIAVPASASAPNVGAAAVGGDYQVFRRGRLLFSVFEQPDNLVDDAAHAAANRHGDGDVELIKFEPPARSELLSIQLVHLHILLLLAFVCLY